MNIKTYFKNVLLGIDQLGNTLIGGSPDETISARTYREYIESDKKKWVLTVKIIEALFSEHHGEEAVIGEFSGDQQDGFYKKFQTVEELIEYLNNSNDSIAVTINDQKTLLRKYNSQNEDYFQVMRNYS